MGRATHTVGEPIAKLVNLKLAYQANDIRGARRAGVSATCANPRRYRREGERPAPKKRGLSSLWARAGRSVRPIAEPPLTVRSRGEVIHARAGSGSVAP